MHMTGSRQRLEQQPAASRAAIGAPTAVLAAGAARRPIRRTAFRSARRSRLEAVLFLAREPLSLRKLAQLANLTDATEARTVLKSLQARYDERQCAFQVAQVAGGYQLMSRREFVTWVRPQSAQEHEFRLSPPSLGDSGCRGLSATNLAGRGGSDPGRGMWRNITAVARSRPVAYCWSF